MEHTDGTAILLMLPHGALIHVKLTPLYYTNTYARCPHKVLITPNELSAKHAKLFKVAIIRQPRARWMLTQRRQSQVI